MQGRRRIALVVAGAVVVAPPGRRFKLYVWVVRSDWHRRGARMVQGTAWSSPAVVTAVASRGSYRIVDEAEPLDYSEPGFSHLFPSHAIRSRILEIDRKTGGGPPEMAESVRRRARRQLFGH